MPTARIWFDYLADYRSQKQYLSRDTLVLLTGDRLSYPASGMPVAPATAGHLELLVGMIRASRSRANAREEHD